MLRSSRERPRRFQSAWAAAVILAITAAGLAGPWADGSDPNSTAIDAGIPAFVDGLTNPAFDDWAAGIVSYTPVGDVDPTWMTPDRALGSATGAYNNVVSLGDLSADAIAAGDSPGQITLRFNKALYDAAGPDLAVFENGIALLNGIVYAELAYVEVSTDGEHFARFASQSLNPPPAGDTYSELSVDSTNIYNLAGKHANGYATDLGTPFDLAQLADHTLVQQGLLSLQRIEYVRIVDIPGSGDFLDSQGNAIYDAWPTDGYPTGGFDLEAVGALHAAWVGDWNRDGQFDSLDLDVLGVALDQGLDDLLYDYNDDGDVDEADLLHFLAEALNSRPGDVDLSGVVDEADLEILKLSYKQSGGWAQGDLNLDGKVDFADYTVLARNWGGTGEVPVLIPEPGVSTVLALGLVGFLSRRKARQST
jgi:hypothetical protein